MQAYRASHDCSYTEAMQGAKKTYRALDNKESSVTPVLYIGSIDKFFEWITDQKYKELVFVAGNHEDPRFEERAPEGAI